MPWPWSKKKCPACNCTIVPPPNEDVMECPGCHSTIPTGLEGDLRDALEKNSNVAWPRIAVGRAICYASDIYALSTHNQRIDTSGIEKKLEGKFGKGSIAEQMSLVEQSGRSYKGVEDQRAGLMVYVVSGRNISVAPPKGQPWTLIYVVFRGSRGELAGSSGNKFGAGWGKAQSGEMQNTDWRANFDNQQESVPWAEPNVKVHAGFKGIYMSVRDKLHNQLTQLLGKHPNASVVVCGHSLGAGLTTVCAHDLESSAICKPFCFAFCSPRVGNLAFVRDFNLKISTDKAVLWSEVDGRQFYRGFVFIQANDPVSSGQKRSFANKMSEKSASKVADSGSIVKQGIYSGIKKSLSKTMIFYHIQNKIRASWFGLHDFKAMEKALLG